MQIYLHVINTVRDNFNWTRILCLPVHGFDGKKH